MEPKAQQLTVSLLRAPGQPRLPPLLDPLPPDDLLSSARAPIRLARLSLLCLAVLHKDPDPPPSPVP